MVGHYKQPNELIVFCQGIFYLTSLMDSLPELPNNPHCHYQ